MRRTWCCRQCRLSAARNQPSKRHCGQHISLCSMAGKAKLDKLSVSPAAQKTTNAQHTNPRFASVVFLQPHAGQVKQEVKEPAHPPLKILKFDFCICITFNIFKTMKQNILNHFFIVMILCSLGSVNGQTLLNQEWVNAFGSPDSIKWSSSTLSNQGVLYVVGNTVNSNADIFISAYDTDGNQLWQSVYNDSTNGNDYGIAVECDYYGNIYLAGVVTNNVGSFDCILLKYDYLGNELWHQIYANGSTTIPTDIGINFLNEIYVTGTSANAATQSDYLLVKYSDAGIFQWAETYDYVGLYDVAVGISFDNNNQPIITGGSQSSANNADYTTLYYDIYGTQLSVDRQNVLGNGFDKPLAITKDALGNHYITGYTQTGFSQDIRVIKLNSNFIYQWGVSYDYQNGIDASFDLAVDINGNTYLTGYSHETNGTKNACVIKYDINGNFLWDRRLKLADRNGSIETEGNHIVVSDNTIYVYGTLKNKEGTFIACYSDLGELLWEKENEINQEFLPNDFVKDNNNIYTFALSKDTLTNQNAYKMIKYRTFNPNYSLVYDTLGKATHVVNQIIVRFHPNSLILSPFESKEIVFGDITEFVKPNIIALMDNKLGLNGLLAQSKVMKLYKNLTLFDINSTSRDGRLVSLPTIWASLIIILPENEDRAIYDEFAVADSLDDLKPHIVYAEPHKVFHFDMGASDPRYVFQHSLHSTMLYANGNINIEPAWDIETGKPHIKIGVYDTGIKWNHEDFSFDGQFANSRIFSGKDYSVFPYVPISNNPNNDISTVGHGTRSAGIIGAMRNNTNANGNNVGIAGIAGGDGNNWNDGCLLYAMKISPLDDPILFDELAPAIIEGAIDVNDGGYGLDIANHSYEGGYLDAYRDAINIAFQNNVTTTASRGNDGADVSAYPATYKDEWVISVGSSDQNEQKEAISNFGSEMDLLAPGLFDMVMTTNNGSSAGTLYDNFANTSAAAPHVAGVAGIILSYMNPPNAVGTNQLLAPEDVEFMVQKYAKDLNTPQYDNTTGWGLLNAGSTMQMLEKPQYDLVHDIVDFDLPDFILQSVNPEDVILERNFPDNLAPILPVGNYKADVYKVSKNINLNVPAGYFIVEDALGNQNTWGLSSRSYLLDYSKLCALCAPSIYPQEFHTSFVSQGNNTALIEGYIYHIVEDMNGVPLDVWIPTDPNLPNYPPSAYSLHITTTPQSVDNQINSNLIEISPNPTNNVWAIKIPEIYKAISYQVIDINGKIVLQGDTKTNAFAINGTNLVSGIYLLRLKSKNEYFSKKIVKY